MTTNTPPAPNMDGIRDAIADIRRITSEENLENFSNEDLLDACIRLLEADDDDAGEEDHADTADGDGDFIATLDAARHRAGNYNDTERAIITRAVSRANRSLANR